MNVNSNEKIRKENIKTVFRAVTEDGCSTRSDVNKLTGISLVTVGKIVEDLLDTGIFLQRESTSKSVGRHAGQISFDESKKVVSVDLSGRDFSFSVYDLALNRVYFGVEEYMEDLTCAEAICRFLHRVKSFMKRESERGIRFMALGIIVPGEYDRKNDTVSGTAFHSFDGVRIKELARSMVGMIPDCVMDHTAAALKYCAEIRAENENLLYIKISGGIKVRLMINGEPIRRRGCVVDKIDGGENLVKKSIDTVVAVMNVCGLDRVVVTSDTLIDATDLKKSLMEELSEMKAGQNIPQVDTVLSYDCACRGVASMLRWQKIERRLKMLL